MNPPAQRNIARFVLRSGSAVVAAVFVAIATLLWGAMCASAADIQRVPPATEITTEHPLIILQTSGGSSDPTGDPMEDARRQGLEVVRVWRDLVPDSIKPYCQLQVELRVRDHATRYALFRALFTELERAAVPVSFQFADPDDEYVFDPVYVEKLTREFSCIKSYMLCEMSFEHYAAFNVERYAVPPQTRFAIDIIEMAARYGKHVAIALQYLKWLHVSVDALNQPLLDTMRAYREYVLPLNEHIGPSHLTRQTAVWGLWMAGLTDHWGVEPQSWWFDSGHMHSPGLFGKPLEKGPQSMPPALYRAMILQGAAMGATVYSFEPSWDLYDYENARCWRDVILPTMTEVIKGKMIPARDEVFEKTKAAYHCRLARDINEFHRNARDIEWIGDEGLLAQAAYGLWQRMLEYELIPNKSRYYFIPLLPPRTPDDVLRRFACVIEPGQCAEVRAYEELLTRYYPLADGEGTAWISSIHGYTYVMQTHENLYERQTYAVDLPKAVRQLRAERTHTGIRISWPVDPLASRYRVYRVEGNEAPKAWGDPVGDVTAAKFVDEPPDAAIVYTYTVTADTKAMERQSGVVNYLDYLVFSQSTSVPAVTITVSPDGVATLRTIPVSADTRPERQTAYPTYEGAEGAHRAVAEAIVSRIDALRDAYEAMDWRAMTAFYSPRYRDANGFHLEYVSRAWKWWFRRNNRTCLLRQIRQWDFGDYETSGLVRVRMWSLFEAIRRDDAPFGYDGIVRIPRHAGEEITYTWARDDDGAWRIQTTDPALPNLEEILWNSRPMDKGEKLVPSIDE